MPTYAYRCADCGHRFEAVQSFTDDALTVCPVCNGTLRKVFNAVGVVFKGSGFYRNDSRAASTSAGSSPASGESGGTSSGSSDSSSGTSPDSSGSSGSSSTSSSSSSSPTPATPSSSSSSSAGSAAAG